MAQGGETVVRLGLTERAVRVTSNLMAPIILLPMLRVVFGMIAVMPAMIAVTAIAIAAISVTTARVYDAAGKSKRNQCQRDQRHFHVMLHCG